MSFDTRYNFNPLPFNIIDVNNANNRNGANPSYQFKKNRIVYLNTAFASSSLNNGSTTYYEFSFNINQFTLYNTTRLRVVSFVSNENTAKPLIIKCKNLLIENSTYTSSDNDGNNIIYISHAGATGMLLNNIHSLILQPQTINNITIKIDDSFTTKDTGFTISSQGVGNFIIGLLFENYDLEPDNAISQYK